MSPGVYIQKKKKKKKGGYFHSRNWQNLFLSRIAVSCLLDPVFLLFSAFIVEMSVGNSSYTPSPLFLTYPFPVIFEFEKLFNPKSENTILKNEYFLSGKGYFCWRERDSLGGGYFCWRKRILFFFFGEKGYFIYLFIYFF